MESVEHVQPDVWHWSAIQTAKMRQSPVSHHIMLDFFLHAVLRQSLLQECKEEMDRIAVQGDRRDFLVTSSEDQIKILEGLSRFCGSGLRCYRWKWPITIIQT